jgi:hypothetical protein
VNAKHSLLAAFCGFGLTIPTIADPIPVNVSNFARAETDMYLSRFVSRGGFGRFDHNRTPAPIDKQDVVRMNRDTFYSAAVFDLEAAPVTITLPNAGKRFMSLLLINEDHYVIAPGWNYLVRLYRPRKEILDGSWNFPEAAPLK